MLLLLFPLAGWAQNQNGMLLLKKHNKVVARWHTGRSISFFTQENHWVSGTISRVSADSLWLVQYQVTRIQRLDGAVYFDTTGRFNMFYSLKDIGGFPRAARGRTGNLLTNGSLFAVGGAAFLGLNLFNTTRMGDPPFGKENRGTVATAAGITAAGLLLQKARSKRIYTGKKYSVTGITW